MLKSSVVLPPLIKNVNRLIQDSKQISAEGVKRNFVGFRFSIGKEERAVCKGGENVY